MLLLFRILIAVAAAVGLGLSLFWIEHFMIVAAVLALSLLVVVLRWPEAGTLAALFVFYTNLPVIAIRFYGVPPLLAASVSLLFLFPLTYFLVVRKSRLVLDQTFQLMLLFLAVLIASSVGAVDRAIAFDYIVTYVTEGLILYFLILNAVRDLPGLRRAMLSLVAAGAVLGGLTILSDLSGSYGSHFGGFVQRNTETGVASAQEDGGGLVRTREKIRTSHRSEGPVGDANRFAQILIVLFPLTLVLFRRASTAAGRLLMLAAGMLMLGGFLLTYSRSGFLVLLMLIALLGILGYVKKTQLLAGAGVVALMIVIVAPGYVSRISSILAVQSFFSEQAAEEPDGATRGRLTEMLAALKAFVDHPFLGVGPGQYTPYYSMSYQADPEIAFRKIDMNRRGHILYFEMAAETGLVGLSCFLGMVLLLMHRLWRMRRFALPVRPELADLATAFCLSVVCYLGTAVFLHLAYQRYYWLLLAMTGAAAEVIRRELRQEEPVARFRFQAAIPQEARTREIPWPR